MAPKTIRTPLSLWDPSVMRSPLREWGTGESISQWSEAGHHIQDGQASAIKWARTIKDPPTPAAYINLNLLNQQDHRYIFIQSHHLLALALFVYSLLPSIWQSLFLHMHNICSCACCISLLTHLNIGPSPRQFTRISPNQFTVHILKSPKCISLSRIWGSSLNSSS